MVDKVRITAREEKMGKLHPFISLTAEGMGELDGLILHIVDRADSCQVGEVLTLFRVSSGNGYSQRPEYRLDFHHELHTGEVRASIPKYVMSYSRQLMAIAAYFDKLENTCPTCGRSCTHPKEN